MLSSRNVSFPVFFDPRTLPARAAWVVLLCAPISFADARRRELDQAVLGHRLEKNPADFEANLNLGAVMLSRLNPQGAITPLETALRADRGRADARNMLGLAFAATGRVKDAIRQYDIVLAADPGDGRALFNRANALMKAGRIGEAIQDYRAAMAAFPEDPLPRQRLESALKMDAGSSPAAR